MKTFACSAIMLLFTISAFTQSTTVRGRVASEDGQPLEFANVLLLDVSDSTLVKGAVSDSLGQYEFKNIANGAYLISATMVGYKAVYGEPFNVNGNSKILKRPILSIGNEGVELNEVVVKATKPFMELKMDRLVINVESSPVAAGNNALELLAKAPGISIDQDNTISLKGRQGVLILIDGKNTYMSNQEIIRMLETMAADDIATIEIVHNPSAKYDAAGNSGIINIKLKKDRSLGLNGNIRIGAGMGNFPKANGGLRMNYRSKKANVYGNYSYYFNRSFQDLNLLRRIPFEGALTIFDQKNHKVRENEGHRITLGTDYFLSDKTTIGVLAKAQIGRWDPVAQNRTVISGDNPEPFNTVNSGSNIDGDWDNYSYNANIRHQFDENGHELTFDADYSSFKRTTDSDYFNFFFNESGQEVAEPNILRSADLSDVIIKAVKLDYVRPLGEKTRLETGWKSSFVTTDNAIDFDVLENEEYVDDPTRTNQFIYDENIHAAYANLSTSISKFNIQLGLRAELTDAEGYSVTLNERFERDYLSLFPSMSVSHGIGEKHQLSYAYSRRIDRPSYQDLNPFVYFLDQYTFGKGNTNLMPQFTHSFSLNYSFLGRYMLNMSYSDTDDVITQVIEQDDENKLSFQTTDNLANFKNFSITASVPINITSWWNSRINLSSFYNDYNSPLGNSTVDNEVLSYFVNMSHNFSIAEGFTAQLSGQYFSRGVWGIYELDPRWSVDLGFSKQILDGRGSLKLNFNDIFFTDITQILVRQGTIDLDARNINETRRANLTFSYNFGNNEVKPARNRKTATEAEQNRVQSGN